MTMTANPAPPSPHRRAVITWLAVYPTITIALALLNPVTDELPLVVRTLILTVVVVPVVVYTLVPALLRANARISARGRTGNGELTD